MSSLLLPNQVNETKSDHLLDGRYQIVQILTESSWQKTFLAKDLRRPSQPECIIQHLKAIPGMANYEAIASQLFTSEAAILEQIGKHPQIPQLLACFGGEHGFYVGYEWIGGHCLSHEWPLEKPQNSEQVAQLLLEILEPLAFAHHCGVRHGNLKPSNVIRRATDDRLVLINFNGIKQIQRSLLVAYAPTSAVQDTELDGYQPAEYHWELPCFASDVYAVGMIGIQALTGMAPSQFDSNPQTYEVLWQQHCQANGLKVKPELATILSRMVQYEPNQRYASAVEALHAVQEFLLDLSLKSAAPTSDSLEQPVPAVPPPIPLVPSFMTSEEAAEPRYGNNVKAGDRSTVAWVFHDTTEPEPPAIAPVTKPAAQPVAKQTTSRKRANPSPQLTTGITAALVLAASGYALVNLPNWTDQGESFLAQATEHFQAGQLEQAVNLAKSIPSNSRAYASAQTAIAQWQRDWKTATIEFRQANQALRAGEWTEVQQHAKTMPPIPYWQEQMNSLVQQATERADADANRLLHSAYRKAMARNFTGALSDLRQISAGTSVYGTVQEKLREYNTKEEIRGMFFLQQAFNQAERRDFAGALSFLRQVPKGTPAAAIAHKKEIEYREKHRIHVQAMRMKLASNPTSASASTGNADLNPGHVLQEITPLASTIAKVP